MEIQKPTTDKIAASIFYRSLQPVKFMDKGEIHMTAKIESKLPTAFVYFTFTDKEVQKEYEDFYQRAVGTRDHILLKDGKPDKVRLSQIDLFLNRYLKGTLHERFQPFFTPEIEKALINHPYRSQDGLGMKAKVIARYFNPTGTGTWYVTEMADYLHKVGKKNGYQPYEKVDKQFQFRRMEDILLFGLAELGYEFEWGSFSMKEISQLLLPHGLEIERDEHIEPLKYTLEECFKMYNEEQP